ncbi:MAG: IPT/TIG domain-containing protein [Gemmatimonadota bacterium]|nr:IPT/TIG domain-containing protein [Gemmatimonadota bacterium]
MDLHRKCRTGRIVTLALLPATLITACSDSPTGSEEPAASTIDLSRSELDFSALGDTAAIAATVRDQNGEPMEGVGVTWGSSDPAVASVSGAGVVTSIGNGSATVTASADEARASASVSVEQVADRLRFLPDPVTLENPGDTTTVVATVVDANGNPMPTESVSWTSNDTSVITVSASGLVEAVGDGADSLSVVADGVAGALAAFVGDDRVVAGSVSPSPMIEGDTATIRGLGFDTEMAGNEVTLDGTAAEVTSASSVELRVIVPDADCRPPREGRLRVAARDMVDSVSAEVRPPSEAVHALAVGDGRYATEGCLHLDTGSSDERYLVGVLSSSEVASSLTPTRLASRTGSRLVAEDDGATTTVARSGTGSEAVGSFRAPEGTTSGATVTSVRRAPAPGGSPALASLAEARPDRSGEARIRAAERAWLESLGAGTPSLATAAGGAAAPQRAPPEEGETLDFTVPESCDTGAEVQAVVRHVGDAAAFLEDVDNPTAGFTRTQYQNLDGLLEQTTLPTLENNFGEFADVDDNDLVLVLITKEVNEKENFAGFVFSGDLVGQDQCGTSNQAEMFYGRTPDPEGVHGDTVEVADLLVQYPPLIAHELTHILQFTALFTTPEPEPKPKTSWELEGGATLAEQLVGYEVLDHGPRMNLDSADWRDGADSENAEPGWYRDWVVDMALYFGFKGRDTPPEEFAPEQCSWIGRKSEGNAGPCENRRAVYGVPSMLLRWVLDQTGDDKLDDEALMRELTRPTANGLDALLEVTGKTRESLLVEFAATLWADDRPGMGDWLPSWNVHNVFQSVVEEARLRPYTSTAAEPTLDVEVRAASSAYLEWTPPDAHDPTSLRIRSPADEGAVPEGMVLWVLRIQ